MKTLQDSSAGRASSGFTLIEVMIVVAIVAILSAIAYPSYRESVARGNRAGAKQALLDNAQWLERQFTVSNTYVISGSLPLTEAPKDGAKTYDIDFVTDQPTASTFTLKATPKNSMTGDKCGTLTLTQTGARGLGSDATASVADCWNR
jgi:type IV pilus assembly protein PilE